MKFINVFLIIQIHEIKEVKVMSSLQDLLIGKPTQTGQTFTTLHSSQFQLHLFNNLDTDQSMSMRFKSIKIIRLYYFRKLL